MRDYQEAFHGSAKNFRDFSFDHLRSGQDSLKFGHGAYFSSSAKTADKYRANVADGIDDAYETYTCTDRDGESVSYEPGDHLYAAAQAIHEWGEYDVALDEANDAGDPELIELIESLGEVSVQQHYGVVYEVRIPACKRLLSWDDGVEDQGIDLMEIVRDLYGSDKLDELSEKFFLQADETVCESEFDEVFELACTHQHDAEVSERFAEVCPDCSLNELKKELGNAHIENHEVFTGQDLYSHLSHALGGPAEASRYLSGKGIPGCQTTDGFMTNVDQAKPQVFTIWDLSEIKILKAVFDPAQLTMDEDSELASDAPDYHW